jgi:hypothetical protein
MPLVAAALGAAVGGLIGLLSAKKIADWNALGAAGSDLRAAFAPEQAIARTAPYYTWIASDFERILGAPERDLDKILEAAFIRHATAIEKFRFFVPVKSLAAYDSAWLNYYLEGKKIGFARYAYGDTGQDDFLRNVDAILRFTKRRRIFKWGAGDSW